MYFLYKQKLYAWTRILKLQNKKEKKVKNELLTRSWNWVSSSWFWQEES